MPRPILVPGAATGPVVKLSSHTVRSATQTLTVPASGQPIPLAAGRPAGARRGILV